MLINIPHISVMSVFVNNTLSDVFMCFKLYKRDGQTTVRNQLFWTDWVLSIDRANTIIING